MDSQSDIIWVTLTRQGNQTAFQHLVETYQRRARKTLAQTLKQQAASDAASGPAQTSFGQLTPAGTKPIQPVLIS